MGLSFTRRALAVGSMAGPLLTFAFSSRAEEQIQPPPYEFVGGNGVGVAVVWDAAAVRKALPPGIQPVKGMIGGINIYSVQKGNVIAPYSAGYFYVDIEGFDSPEGVKGRWMLTGVYGPQAKTSAALKAYYGIPIRPGQSRIEPNADGKRATIAVNGHDVVTAKVKPADGACQPGAVRLNYVSLSPQTKQVSVLKIPFVGEFCKAAPVSADVTAPAGDPFAAFPIAKVIGASEFKNGSFAFSAPQPAGH